MNTLLRNALAVAGLALATTATAEVIFYEHDDFQGRSFNTNRRINDFDRQGFNDRASSVVVLGERWEVCEHARFEGRCVVLRPGRYPSLSAMGLNDRVSSVRSVSQSTRVRDDRYAPPPPQPVYDNRRRNNERLYEADVTSVRAVMGADQQRCWVEREQVASGGGPNIGGAVVGAILGGVIGHQIGSGRGNDAATAGGAIAGGVIGSNVNRDRGGSYTQDVQRCTSVPNQNPAYWDVTYNFRGTEHRVQMAVAPGRTVTVNQRGEPRA